MNPIIRFENVSKVYRLRADRPRSFRELFVTLSRLGQPPTQRPTSLWALRDVSFQIQPGEAVGLIGINGAGKSTCLKAISRVITPTTGHVEVIGQVAALLELG